MIIHYKMREAGVCGRVQNNTVETQTLTVPHTATECNSLKQMLGSVDEV